MNLKIRKARKEDLKDISQVEMSSGYHKKKFNFIPIITKLFKDKNESIFVLLKNNKIIGYVDLRIKNKVGEINFLSITREEQGKRFGLRLMVFILKYAKENKCKKVILQVRNDNNKAISLYNKLDFKSIESIKRSKIKMENLLK